jgi:hypothetical protein
MHHGTDRGWSRHQTPLDAAEDPMPLVSGLDPSLASLVIVA